MNYKEAETQRNRGKDILATNFTNLYQLSAFIRVIRGKETFTSVSLLLCVSVVHFPVSPW